MLRVFLANIIKRKKQAVTSHTVLAGNADRNKYSVLSLVMAIMCFSLCLMQ